MKKELILLLFCMLTYTSIAQKSEDKKGVETACYNYIDGFYQGDTTKLEAALSPTLYKMGYWKDDKEGAYRHAGHMSYDKAMTYAKNVLKEKKFPKKDAPRHVEILNMGNHIAAAKITAWWGIDYALLSKSSGKWMIEQVLWEGPLDKDN